MSDNVTWISWVQAAQRGDAASFDRLVAAYRRYAIGYAFTLTGSTAQAEDVAQEAFLTAWRQLGMLQQATAFPGWFRRLVFKHADRQRRARRPLVPLDAAQEIPAPHTDLARMLLCQEQEEALVRALVSLPEAERVALILFYQGGHKQAEIADYLGVSVAAVKKRLERGRRKLRGDKNLMSLLENETGDGDTPQATRFVEVNRLLRDLVAQLDADPQVAVAYLARWGDDEGLGPENDAWASLNLHVVIRDAYLDHFAEGRLRYASRAREPLLWVEAPQNAPAHGYYLMALYDGAQGPYEVNWYWKPLSHNRTIPEQALVLLNKDILPGGDPVVWSDTPPTPPPALTALLNSQTETEKRQEALCNQISLFWAMWFICARYIIRNPQEERMNFVPMLCNLLRDTRNALAEPQDSPHEEVPTPTPEAKRALLQTLAAEMEALHPRAIAQGAHVPVVIVPRAARFLETVTNTISGKSV